MPSGQSTRTPLPSVGRTPLTVSQVTQICELWGASMPDSAILCGDGIWRALDALGNGVAAPVRAVFSYTQPCDGNACPPRSSGRASVTVTAPVGSAIEVGLELDAEGAILVYAPEPVEPPAPPLFDPPSPARPDVGVDPPSVVVERAPLPHCGQEDVGLAGPYDGVARRCFLNGVLAGLPVEFVSSSTSTEGTTVLTIHRYAGFGPVIRMIQEGPTWRLALCGIAPLATEVVFVSDGECELTDL